MALLDPRQIHEVLSKVSSPVERPEKETLKELLRRTNLSPEEILDQVSAIMRGGETEGNRLRAAETALKLNGLLTSEDNRDFTIVINIQDSEFSINPILIPR